MNPKESYEGFEGAINDAANAMRRVLVFLRDDAQIPHLRLLPYKSPLIVLPRFFSLFPEPIARSRELLVRWVWRGFSTGAHADTRRPLREGVRCIDDEDEEASVQHLLNLLPRSAELSWMPGERFDPRAAGDRIGLLALASLRPISFLDYTEFDLAAALDDHGSEAIVALDKKATSIMASLGGRILHPPSRDLLSEISALASTGAWPGLLESHALDGPALDHLHAKRWDYGDRPSISRYLHEASE